GDGGHRRAQRLDAEPDEIGGAEIFQHGEGEGGGGDDRRHADRRGDDMGEIAKADPGHRDQPAGAALLYRAGDDVQHGGAGGEQQHERGAEEEEIGGKVDHGAPWRWYYAVPATGPHARALSLPG